MRRGLLMLLMLPVGCVSLPGTKAAEMTTVQARLSPAIIGQSTDMIDRSAGPARLIRVADGGVERIELRQADRDPRNGGTLFCTETLTVQGRTITGYHREGNSC